MDNNSSESSIVVPTKPAFPWLQIVLTLLFGFVTGIGGFLLGKYTINTTVNTTETKPISQEIVMKEYVNKELGFSFSYPNNLSETTQTAISGPYTGTSKLIANFADLKTVRSNTDAPFAGFSVYLVSNLGTKTIDEYLVKELKASQTSERGNPNNALETIRIGSVNSYKIDDPTIILYYIPQEDNKILAFARINMPGFNTTFDQILASFKFLGNDIVWEKYLNDYLSFEYPSGFTNVNGQLKSPDSQITLNPTEIMYTECMEMQSNTIVGSVIVRKFKRALGGDFCGTENADSKETWVLVPKTSDQYGPGVIIYYSQKDEQYVNRIAEKISQTLKLIDKK